MLFAALLVPLRGGEEATEFVTGYLIELSLSLDNVLVIALIFASFRVPPAIPASRAVLGHPRRAGHARRDDRRGRGAHPAFQIGCFTSSAPSWSPPARKCFSPNPSRRAGKKSRRPPGAQIVSRRAGARRAEIHDPLERPAGAHAAGAGAAAGGNHRLDFRRGFRAGGVCGDAEGVHRFHLQRLCHPRPAFAVFSAGRRDGHISAI